MTRVYGPLMSNTSFEVTYDPHLVEPFAAETRHVSTSPWSTQDTTARPYNSTINATSNLGIGTYTAVFRVSEKDTAVYAEKNVTFTVVEIPFSATFLGGSSRWQEREGNISLWVEVHSPSPHYSLSWSCHFLHDPQTSCFTVLDPWDNFYRTVKKEDTLDWMRRSYEKFKVWLSDRPVPKADSDEHQGTPRLELNEEATFRYSSRTPPPQSREALRENSKGPATQPDQRSNVESSDEKGSLNSYVETLTFPSYLLQPLSYELLFQVSVTQEDSLRPPEHDQQLLVLQGAPVVDVGIVRHFDGILPLGATDRVVFEAICFSCFEEDLEYIEYKWTLKKLPSDVIVGPDFVTPLEEVDGPERTRRGGADDAMSTSTTVEDEAGQSVELGILFQKIIRGSENLEFDFMPRFRDYLKIYNSSAVEELINAAASSSSGVIDVVSGYDKSLEQSGSKKGMELPHDKVLQEPPVSEPDRSGDQSSGVNKFQQKKPRSTQTILVDGRIDPAVDSIQASSVDGSQHFLLESSSQWDASSYPRYDSPQFLDEKQAVQVAEKMLGRPIDRALIKRARELYFRSQSRRHQLYKKEAAPLSERLQEYEETIGQTVAGSPANAGGNVRARYRRNVRGAEGGSEGGELRTHFREARSQQRSPNENWSRLDSTGTVGPPRIGGEPAAPEPDNSTAAIQSSRSPASTHNENLVLKYSGDNDQLESHHVSTAKTHLPVHLSGPVPGPSASNFSSASHSPINYDAMIQDTDAMNHLDDLAVKIPGASYDQDGQAMVFGDQGTVGFGSAAHHGVEPSRGTVKKSLSFKRAVERESLAAKQISQLSVKAITPSLSDEGTAWTNLNLSGNSKYDLATGLVQGSQKLDSFQARARVDHLATAWQDFADAEISKVIDDVHSEGARCRGDRRGDPGHAPRGPGDPVSGPLGREPAPQGDGLMVSVETKNCDFEDRREHEEDTDLSSSAEGNNYDDRLWSPGPEGRREARSVRHHVISEGNVTPVRSSGYLKLFEEYVSKHGTVPNLSCAPEHWELCATWAENKGAAVPGRKGDPTVDSSGLHPRPKDASDYTVTETDYPDGIYLYTDYDGGSDMVDTVTVTDGLTPSTTNRNLNADNDDHAYGDDQGDGSAYRQSSGNVDTLPVLNSAPESHPMEDVFPSVPEDTSVHQIIREPEPASPTTYPAEARLQRVVPGFRSMTTTGLRQPVLVLYTHALDQQATYVLSLATRYSLTNVSGLSKELLQFSPQPQLRGCYVRALDVNDGGRYKGSCYQYSGIYYPITFQWSYHHTLLGSKTIFYHGSLPEIEFTLPPGLESTGYKVFLTAMAIDGRAVSKTLNPKTIMVHPRHDSGAGVVSIFKEISRMQANIPSLELQQVRALAWELNLIETSVVSQTVFDNILAIFFYRESCKDSLETVTEDFSDTISDSSVIEALYRVNMLKSCARDHLAEIACASDIRDEMEILQVQSALSIVLGAPEFISSKTFFRVVDAMWRMQRQHLKLWDYRTEIRSEVAKQYFALGSTVLDKQKEIYDLSVVSVNTTDELVVSLLRVMSKEVHTRFLEESPLRYSTSTLQFTGFLTEGYAISSRIVGEMFELMEGNVLPAGVQAVMCLVHLESPYMVPGAGGNISTRVLHLQMDWNKTHPLNVKVRLPRSTLLSHAEYDFRRPGILRPESLSVFELVVTKNLQHLALHVQLEVQRVYDPDFPVAAIALICPDMQSLDAPLQQLRLPAARERLEGTLLVPPNTLGPGTYVLVIMDQNSYDTRWSRRLQRHSPGVSGAEYLVSAWWSECLVWNTSLWNTGLCEVELSSWDLMQCICSSNSTVFGGVTLPILTEKDTITVNELMLKQSYAALYFIVILLILYGLLAALLSYPDGLKHRRNIWLRDNRASHENAYLLTVKTGTQWDAGTGAKVLAILHGTAGMSETRELQSSDTGHLFVRGSVCSFIITTEQDLGDILKVQLWHNNVGDECKSGRSNSRSAPSSTVFLSSEPDSSSTSGLEASGVFDFEDHLSSEFNMNRSSFFSSQYSSSADLASQASDDLDAIRVERESDVSSGSSNSRRFRSYSRSSLSSLTQTSKSSESLPESPSKSAKSKNEKTDKASSKDSVRTCCPSYRSCGSEAAWFVCEVRVSELQTGAVFDFPCYSWLSVTEEVAKVEKEISLETPTTFWQDVEHFLPQFASESVVWTSLVSSSHSVRFYRLQRLTICLIVCLGLGTLSLNAVKRINMSHTMITPDLHLEPLFYGHALALLLMPVQWLLEGLFSWSNRLEAKASSIKFAKETIENLRPQTKRSSRHTKTSPGQDGPCASFKGKRSPSEDSSNYSNFSATSTDSVADILNPDMDAWNNLVKWADNFTVPDAAFKGKSYTCQDSSTYSNFSATSTDSVVDILKPDMDAWKNLTKFTDNFTVPDGMDNDGLFQRETRRRQNAGDPRVMGEESDPLSLAHIESLVRQQFQAMGIPDKSEKPLTESKQKMHSHKTLDRNDDASNEPFSAVQSKSNDWRDSKLSAQKSEESEAQHEKDEDEEYMWERPRDKWFKLGAQILAWSVCGLIVGLCCVTLIVHGIEMPLDYTSLWMQIIYITLCASALVVQPLIVAIYTVCKVVLYRVCYGCRGSLTSCLSLPLDQTVAIWRRYRAVFGAREEEDEDGSEFCDGDEEETSDEEERHAEAVGHVRTRSRSDFRASDSINDLGGSGTIEQSTENDQNESSTNSERQECGNSRANSSTSSDHLESGYGSTKQRKKKMAQLARNRNLRFSLPPSEEVLLQCRLRELRRQQISSFLTTLVQFTVFMLLLLVIVSNYNVSERHVVNSVLQRSIKNGTCLSDKDDCYIKFTEIKNTEDWWNWAYSELMALTYNFDDEVTDRAMFCDTNAIIIGMPRIRKYSVAPMGCAASKFMLNGNESFASSLGVRNCYPEYKDEVQHLANFDGEDNKKYEWDAHYLAVLHGLYSQYSYTKYEYELPQKEFSALLYLVTLEAADWLTQDEPTRAIITEFTLYHPQNELYSSINLIAEFPPTSGAELSVAVQSTHLQRYRTPWSYFSMYAEVLLLPAAMYYLVKSLLYLYRCRLRCWHSFWGVLDLILTVLLWYYIVCLMLRVHITEDLLWQLKVSYYQKFVNLKSAMTWDRYLKSLLGLLVSVHIVRCLWLLNFFPRFRRLGLTVSKAVKDVINITLFMMVIAWAFMVFGYLWLHEMSFYFNSIARSIITVLSLSTRLDTAKINTDDFPVGVKLFANIYIALIGIFLLMLSRALFFSAFLHARKTHVHYPRPVEITVLDIICSVFERAKSFLPFWKWADVNNPSIASPVDSVPSTLYLSELDRQMNHVIDKVNSVCSSMGLDLSNLETPFDTDSSSLDDVGSVVDGFAQKTSNGVFMRHAVKNTSTRHPHSEWDGSENNTVHVDGFTEVGSLRSAVADARRLVEGIRVFPGSASVTSGRQPRQVIVDKNDEKFTKFLRDVHTPLDENISSSFSKYGKHYKKLKDGGHASVGSKESLAVDSGGRRQGAVPKITLNERLRKTETLGRCKNSKDFWELNVLDLSDSE